MRNSPIKQNTGSESSDFIHFKEVLCYAKMILKLVAHHTPLPKFPGKQSYPTRWLALT